VGWLASTTPRTRSTRPWSRRTHRGRPPARRSACDDPGLRPDRWTIRTVLDRLDEVGDPFRGVLVQEQELPAFS
jgi:bifunctional non-homologous end joining protein LigD